MCNKQLAVGSILRRPEDVVPQNQTYLAALLLNSVRVLSLGFILCSVPSFAQLGVPLWTNRYNGFTGPGAHPDEAYALATDGGGNVYVTGISRGNGTSNDFATLKYSSAGVPLWTNRYNGPANQDDYANAVAANINDNIFVTGSSSGNGSSYDFATIAYSSAGMALWTNRYNGPGNGEDHAVAIAVDSNSNVVVTGYSLGNGTGINFATIKYSSSGVGLWTNRFGGPVNSYERPQAMALDGSGNVYVTGYRRGGGDDYLTIAYSSSGFLMWTNRYDGPRKDIYDPSYDQARAVAVDSNSNVYVTGVSRIGSPQDFTTIKYSPAGIPLWTNHFSNIDDAVNALAVDSSGNVFVTGSSWNVNSSSDYATIAYSSSGVALWTNFYNGPANSGDAATGVALDGSGNVFVTGTSWGGDSSYDYATIAYSSTGVPLWTNHYNGPGNYNDERTRLAVDSNGNVFITGTSDGGGGLHEDYATIKYGPTVSLQIEKVGSKVVLSWANVAFGLQYAPSTSGVFTNVPGAISPYTNSATGSQQFFRLKEN